MLDAWVSQLGRGYLIWVPTRSHNLTQPNPSIRKRVNYMMILCLLPQLVTFGKNPTQGPELKTQPNPKLNPTQPNPTQGPELKNPTQPKWWVGAGRVWQPGPAVR